MRIFTLRTVCMSYLRAIYHCYLLVQPKTRVQYQLFHVMYKKSKEKVPSSMLNTQNKYYRIRSVVILSLLQMRLSFTVERSKHRIIDPRLDKGITPCVKVHTEAA